MARWIIPLLIVSIIFFLVELYAYQALKTITKNKSYRWLWIIVNTLVYVQLLVMVLTSSRAEGQTRFSQISLGILLLFLLPKAIIILTMFGEDIYRWFIKVYNLITNSEDKSLPGRRKFISQIALGIAAIPFASFIYGMIQGKYNYKVIKYELAFDDLPEAFDDFTITQVSDIHSGSFTEREKVQYAVDLIKQQESDLLLFTGDIVNNMASEMDDFVA